VKIESIFQVKGRGTVAVCVPPSTPHVGSILRHADGRVWLVASVEQRLAALLIRPAAEGQAELVEGDDVEMVEPLTLAARVAAMEARIATLDALKAIGDRQEALADRFAARCEALEAGLREALDGWEGYVFGTHIPGDGPGTRARLRALAAGTTADAGEEPAR
jgi:hypothetical protein